MRSLTPALSVTVAAALLAACSSSNGLPPGGQAFGQMPSAVQHIRGAQLTSMGSNVQPAATCSTKYLGCYTVSLSKGLDIDWCYGPKKDPCEDTTDYTWSGNVCTAKSKKCGAIEQMTAAWSGPYKCTKKIAGCHKKKGDWEEDKISIGKTPPKKTTQYAYKQEIKVCAGSSCGTYYIGLNVGS
jgi:hypothetical protein